ncbi:MAG: DUF2330 domain-containing protein [bacterium]|nr:DUF2330 domain-containing protein [bacterium]
MKTLLPHLILLCMMALVPGLAGADGLMLTAPAYYVYETGQQAFIRYDNETQQETLSILPTFRGQMNELAWIIPTPALPEVAEEDEEVFHELYTATSPVYRRRDNDWDSCSQNDSYFAEPGNDSNVDIIDSQLIGYYQTMTLAAEDASALVDSLSTWGFLHENNIAEITPLINQYVEDDWYFVTVKVDSTTMAQVFPYGMEYYQGQLQPLKLSFSSDEIIFPMRISAPSAHSTTRVSLYLLSDHRMHFPGFQTLYANRFTQEEIDGLPAHFVLNEIFQPGDFLTLLRDDLSPSEMLEDLIIVPAPNDDEFMAVHYSGLPWMTVLLMGPAIIWLAYRRFKKPISET